MVAGGEVACRTKKFIMSIDESAKSVNLSRSIVASGMNSSFIATTRSASKRCGLIFRDMLPNIAPRIKVAKGIAARPSMAVGSRTMSGIIC